MNYIPFYVHIIFILNIQCINIVFSAHVLSHSVEVGAITPDSQGSSGE